MARTSPWPASGLRLPTTPSGSSRARARAAWPIREVNRASTVSSAAAAALAALACSAAVAHSPRYPARVASTPWAWASIHSCRSSEVRERATRACTMASSQSPELSRSWARCRWARGSCAAARLCGSNPDGSPQVGGRRHRPPGVEAERSPGDEQVRIRGGDRLSGLGKPAGQPAEPGRSAVQHSLAQGQHGPGGALPRRVRRLQRDCPGGQRNGCCCPALVDVQGPERAERGRQDTRLETLVAFRPGTVAVWGGDGKQPSFCGRRVALIHRQRPQHQAAQRGRLAGRRLIAQPGGPRRLPVGQQQAHRRQQSPLPLVSRRAERRRPQQIGSGQGHRASLRLTAGGRFGLVRQAVVGVIARRHPVPERGACVEVPAQRRGAGPGAG